MSRASFVGRACACLFFLISIGLAQEPFLVEFPFEGIEVGFRTDTDPPDFEVLGDLESYLDVERELPALLDRAQISVSQLLLEHVQLLSFEPEPADEPLCSTDLDAQKFRIAGGNSVDALIAEQDPGESRPSISVWVVDPAGFLMANGIDLAEADGFTLVIVDDFDLTALGSDTEPSNDRFSEPHGHLVLYHVLRLLDKIGETDFGQLDIEYADNPTNPDIVAPWTSITLPLNTPSSEDQVARLVLIDFDFEIDRLAVAIDLANEQIVEAEERSAVNMSWNLVPCRLHDAYTEYDDNGDLGGAFESYVDYLWEISKNNVTTDKFVELYEAFVHDDTRDASDPAFNFRVLWAASKAFATQRLDANEVSRLIDPDRWYASAGNQFMEFALPPASFPNVHAVGACEFVGSGPTLEHAEWSNRGAASLLGAWYAAPDPAGLPYGGTSFAAPLAAMAHASEIGVGMVSCMP